MKPIAIAAVLAAVVVVAAAAIVIVTNDPSDKKECDVVVTMGWEKEIIDTLTDNSLNTVTLMAENTSPHAAYSTTSTIQYLNNAKLFVEIDSGIEWEDTMLSGVAVGIPAVSCMQIIESAEEAAGHNHEEEEENHDGHNHGSHIWVSPEHLELIAEGLADILKERFPEIADKVDAGLDSYMHGIEHIVSVADRIISEKVPGQTIFVWHNAWEPLVTYLNEVATERTGTAYGENNPFIRIESGEDAGGGDVPTFSTLEYMNSRGVNKTVYVSPFDTASQYKSVFEDNGFTVTEINPTADGFADELDKFMHSLDSILLDKS